MILSRFLAATLAACLGVVSGTFAQATPSVDSACPRELSRLFVPQADGGSLTFILSEPPGLRRLPAPCPPLATLSTEDRATAERRAAKAYEVVLITAHVFLVPRPLTLVRWEEDGVVFRAVSNLDFRWLTPVREFETEKTLYLWLPLVTTLDQAPIEKEFAAVSRELVAGVSDYALLDASARKHPPHLLALLDHLHAYAEINRGKLQRDFALREREERAAEERRRLPVPPRHRTIRYWLERGATR